MPSTSGDICKLEVREFTPYGLNWCGAKIVCITGWKRFDMAS
jgi:hypothetical protein